MFTDNEAKTSRSGRWKVCWGGTISYVVRISQNIILISSTRATAEKDFLVHREMIHPVWQLQSVTGPIHDHKASPACSKVCLEILSWGRWRIKEKRYCGRRVLYDIQSPEKPPNPRVTDVLHKYANTWVFRKLLINSSVWITVPHL